jgi:polyphosphate kinase
MTADAQTGHDPVRLLPPRSLYLNRELSWLAFNERVLEEASNAAHPLLERLKFLSISSGNLDEFFMTRVAGLIEQRSRDPLQRSTDGLTPEEQIVLIRERAGLLFDGQQECWRRIRAELAAEGYPVCSFDALTPQDKSVLESYFNNSLFSALSPIIVDAAHPIPFLPNLGLAVIVRLDGTEGPRASEMKHIHRYGRAAKAIVVLPAKIDRFIALPPGGEGERARFAFVEDAIRLFVHKLFPKQNVLSFGLVHVTRDSDLEIEEDAEDLVSHFESAVKRRRRGRVIRLQADSGLSPETLRFLTSSLEREEDASVASAETVCLSHIMELYRRVPEDRLRFAPHKERFPERVYDHYGNYFAAIRSKDMIIHHPYETFDVVVDFLHQAAYDPDVIAIKQTLYRAGSESPVVKALVAAAEAGKAVTAVVELKARFDEEANIRWARNLERAGAQVVFGFVDLKTHAKLSLVVRRENGILKNYMHCGTGNYHHVTAKAYADLSFFTCDDVLCRDAANVFNFLTGYADANDFEHIVVSPLHLRKKMTRLIRDEIEHAEKGEPAAVWAKMNALVDPGMIDLLYEASRKGVKIALVVRGVCCLRPGVPGLSENITVKSIVGRFLEHERIYCFGNGRKLPSAEAKLFIASADLMPRNLDRRVEVMVPIFNPTVHEQILGQIMSANLRDNMQSWRMDADGRYARTQPKEGEAPFSAHRYFMENPSLSGRGKSLRKGKRKKTRFYGAEEE